MYPNIAADKQKLTHAVEEDAPVPKREALCALRKAAGMMFVLT